MSGSDVLWPIGGAFALVGGIFLAALVLRSRRMRRWSRAAGTVRGLDGSTGRGRGFFVGFEFVDHRGFQHSGRSSMRVSPAPAVGSTVTVRYNPDNPLENDADLVVVTLVLAIIGGVFTLVGLGLLTVAAVLRFAPPF
ncbi:MAG: DUF3592 domain-containing protein [Propionibacteriaceae bacterium]|nr:DUF3592 domain-containing protein [Propionibacteriaceae bacterium]